LMRGRVSAYALRDAYRIVFSNRRLLRFSLYRISRASRSLPRLTTATGAALVAASGTTAASEDDT
jgi:hypothetical protein